MERYLGAFGERDGPHHAGELIIASAETRLKFVGRGLHDLDGVTTVYGRTEKNEKVSCFSCFTTFSAPPFFDSDDNFERIEMLPNFTIIGNEHLDPSQPAIRQARFKFSDTELFFEDRNAFGSIFNVGDELQQIFDTRVPPIEKKAAKNSLLSYFCGDFNIIKSVTPIGVFSADYSLKVDSGRPFARDVSLSLTFDEAISFQSFLRRQSAIRRFFSVVTGRPQGFLRLEIMVSRTSGARAPELTPLRVYLARPPSGPTSLPPSHLLGAPVNPITKKEEFSKVMTAWFDMDEMRYMSRRQYVECIENETHYTTNRLVAAANMFDTLPSDALPADVVLPEDFSGEVKETLGRLEMLPKTDYRDSLIGHLGRLNKPSLPAKLYHRSALICGCMDEPLPHLKEVLRIAAQFRNFLVHGSSSFDYEKYDSFVPFLTNALEFVFAASDLVDAGWDINRWCVDNVWGEHQFTRFVRDYPHWIEAFMAAKRSPRTQK